MGFIPITKLGQIQVIINAQRTSVVLAGMLAGQVLAAVLALLVTNVSWHNFAILSFVIQWHLLIALALIGALQAWLAHLPLRWQAVVCWLCSVISALIVQWVSNFLDFRPFSSTTVGAAILISAIVIYSLYQHQRANALHSIAAQAQAEALSARINPHFLFNTLNSIASLAASGSDKTEEAVLALSDMFRASLKQSHADHSLEDELRLIDDYLLLEQLRLGERLRYVKDIERLPPFTIPVLLLQPLVENAIKHGIAPSVKGGEVKLSIRQERGYWRISISNPIVKRERVDGLGIAVATTEARLKLAFGNDSQVIRSVHNGQYLVSLVIKAA